MRHFEEFPDLSIERAVAFANYPTHRATDEAIDEARRLVLEAAAWLDDAFLRKPQLPGWRETIEHAMREKVCRPLMAMGYVNRDVEPVVTGGDGVVNVGWNSRLTRDDVDDRVAKLPPARWR